MRLQAVLMNDTSGSRHFGCERVVRVIGEQLRARDIELASPAAAYDRIGSATAGSSRRCPAAT